MDTKNNKFESNKKYFTICIYAILVILIGALAIKTIFNWSETLDGIRYFFNKMSSFFIGFLIAYIVNPLVTTLSDSVFTKKLKLKSKKAANAFSILIAYIIVIGFIYICLLYIIPQIIKSLGDIYDKVPVLYEEVSITLNKLANQYPEITNQYIYPAIDNYLPDFIDYFKGIVSNIIPRLYSFSLSIIKWAFNIIFAFMVSIYMTTDKNIFKNILKKQLFAFFTKEKAVSIIETLKEVHDIFGNYIIGKAIDSLIIGILCFIFMSIFHLDYAILISVIVGVTNMIPYFGPFIGAVPGSIILLIISPFKMFIFILLILVLQQFDGWILGPKILSNSTGVRPIGILFAITIGGAYFGVIGMFLGVPVFAVLIYLFEKFVTAKLKSKPVSNELDPEIINASINTAPKRKKEKSIINDNIPSNSQLESIEPANSNKTYNNKK